MHFCSTLLVSCIDFRIQRIVEEWARERLGERQYDRVAVAGGVKDLPSILKQIDLSVKLHNIKKVVLMNHEDCGAYLPAEKRPTLARQSLGDGGSPVRRVEWQAKAGGAAGTEEKHRQDLLAASRKIRSTYPDLTVETYYLTLDGSVLPA